MKTVTEISAQKNNPKRCNIYLDGEFFGGIELITVMQNRLKVGSKVSQKELEDLVYKSDLETATQKALNYISRAMHTKMQVIKYLKGKGYQGKIIFSVIDKLMEYGYIDDESFSNAYVAQKTGKGQRLIGYELKQKGVSQEVIDSVMDNAPNESERAYFVAQKFFKGKDYSFENVAKCYRRLISKGFDYDVAKSVVDTLKRENEDNQT